MKNTKILFISLVLALLCNSGANAIFACDIPHPPDPFQFERWADWFSINPGIDGSAVGNLESYVPTDSTFTTYPITVKLSGVVGIDSNIGGIQERDTGHVSLSFSEPVSSFCLGLINIVTGTFTPDYTFIPDNSATYSFDHPFTGYYSSYDDWWDGCSKPISGNSITLTGIDKAILSFDGKYSNLSFDITYPDGIDKSKSVSKWNIGEPVPPTPEPEPSSMLIAGIGGLALLVVFNTKKGYRKLGNI